MNSYISRNSKIGLRWSMALHFLLFVILLLASIVGESSELIGGLPSGTLDVFSGSTSGDDRGKDPFTTEKKEQAKSESKSSSKENEKQNLTKDADGTGENAANSEEEKFSSGIRKGVEGADSTLATQLFSESSLNVRVKYPQGWKYVDQNKKNKLDGVVFMNSNPDMKNPPYIILEVKDRYYFNAKKFKHKQELKHYTLYFNDAKELAGEVSFIVYIRTNGKEDYTFTLRIKGMDSFAEYKPVFFSMLKSFKFGSFWDEFF